MSRIYKFVLRLKDLLMIRLKIEETPPTRYDTLVCVCLFLNFPQNIVETNLQRLQLLTAKIP